MNNEMTGRWHNDQPHMYGDEITYKLAAEFLDGFGPIEDWGCGASWFKNYIKNSFYKGIDGSDNADQIADLREYKSTGNNILLRHVLEHNEEWEKILENAIASFSSRMCVVVFTPFQDNETKILSKNKRGIPDIGFKKESLIFKFIDPKNPGRIQYREEEVETKSKYKKETIFYLERI